MPSTQQQVTSTDSYNYLLFLPDGVRAGGGDRKETQQPLLPTILFLHGAGQRGSNLDDVKKQGIAKIVEQQPDFPFIVISPQCPRGEYWNVERLSALLDKAIPGEKPQSGYASYVDPDRVYLTGLSMGGYGTWHLAAAQPQRFAAIAPICGGGNPQAARKLKTFLCGHFTEAKIMWFP
ncbi:prolyl oligopeptidase family serine peptidase [Nostoc sp. 'Peltigera malacea cyanobiont' DB3992]|uniref:carboxylesterase family protein n=1 Tax=Nostoc sp. 'Peltigera malacea cyanobiont' DB3992 TaxID=1206980 RepID=UPI00211EB200|nr:prolyl oligopeptidase family serine peptidase [Nostoc sp. 'Peltigera malacea cyanobiont' DB3992]